MAKYRAKIEYKQADKHDEEAMLEVERMAFSKAIPFLRNREFEKVAVSTHVQRVPEYADLSLARCTVEMVEQE